MFLGICNTMRNKHDKITEIFGQLEHLKNWVVILLAENIGPVIAMIQHQLQNQLGYHWFCSWCHILMITGPIFLAKNMTPWFLRWSSCSNISVILPPLFLMVFPKIQKHRSLAVATLSRAPLDKRRQICLLLRDFALPMMLISSLLSYPTSHQDPGIF